MSDRKARAAGSGVQGDPFEGSTTGSVSIRSSARPATAGWKYLSFVNLALDSGATYHLETGDQEVGVVPLSGSCHATIGGAQVRLARCDVFAERGSVLYLPPGTTIEVHAEEPATLALGGAPATPSYPLRLIEPSEPRVELRGGGAARRQVGHLLAPPLPAHRLIIYEVYVPRGTWSGWPPHCHDGLDGSPYLEETYYFELDPPDGFAIHRNFREAQRLDDTFVARHRDLVLVPAGYHSTAACPGSNMYFLNFLAGDLEHGDRRTPPCFDARYTWIEGDWDKGAMTLPTAVLGSEHVTRPARAAPPG
jgi:5-deoxy-glucuronate isomerase